MSYPPTEKQINYLHALGYKGTPPITSREASILIDAIKSGAKPAKAEKRMLAERQKSQKRQLADIREYLKGLDEMNAQYPTCAGFRLEVDSDEAAIETRQYHKAFLPLEVAKRHIEILMLPGLYFDDELERVPQSGKFVVAPGQIQVVQAKRGKKAPKAPKPTTAAGGCLRSIVRIIAIILFIIIAVIAVIIWDALR